MVGAVLEWYSTALLTSATEEGIWSCLILIP